MSGQQSKCTGYLVFQQAAASSVLDVPQYETHCYGMTSSVSADGVVDLVQHNETRNRAVEHHNVEMYSLNCVGSAIYQQGPSVPGGQTPPPFCLGVEYVRYSQALMHSRAATAAPHTAHSMQPSRPSSSIPGPAPGDTIFHPAGSSSRSPPVDPQPAAAYTNQHHSIPSSTSSSPQQTPMGPSLEDDDEVKLGLIERIQRTHQLVHERFEGKDPLWFAKAFSNRAALNWASMKRMAGEMATAVKADLGLQESEEPK